MYSQVKKTIYLIGDSTMADQEKPEENPEHGWGQMLPDLMTSEINIDNRALNGRSSRSFISEGVWQEVLDTLKASDYVFIQFGHNDQKSDDPHRYANAHTQYRANLQRYVNETRNKGAVPILLTSIIRRNFNEQGTLIDTHGEYPFVTRIVAKNMDVPLIDLQLFTEQLEIYYGPEESKKLHLHLQPGENTYEPDGRNDDTHLSKMGATLIATLALQEIAEKEQNLKKFIKPETLQKEVLK